jgi:hypothetical protein
MRHNHSCENLRSYIGKTKFRTYKKGTANAMILSILISGRSVGIVRLRTKSRGVQFF